MEDLVCRKSTALDTAAILDMRNDIYGGSDYLPAYIDHFMRDPDRVCLVCETGNLLVGFCCLHVIDAGTSYVLQAGRVRKDMEGEGVMRFLLSYCRQEALRLGCIREVSLCNSLNQHINTTSYRSEHTPVLTKVASRYWLGQDRTFDNISELCPLRRVTETDLHDVISSPQKRHFLFPHDRILVDLISFRTDPQNIYKLRGRNTKFFSNVVEIGNRVTGLLSAFSVFPVRVTAFHSILDIYGSDVTALEDHMLTIVSDHAEHASRGLSMTIVVDSENMAKEIRDIMKRYNINPWKWDDTMKENCFYQLIAFESDLSLTI